jgi:hypothetical protein
MTKEQLQIQAAYGKIAKQLEEMRDHFLAEAIASPEEFDGITIEDACIWFIEGLCD